MANIGKRSRAMAQGGAFRTSLQALQGRTAQLSAREQREWASKLLPDRQQGARAPVLQAEGRPQPAQESQEVPKPLDGVHFARLSAPGPSGSRPEHLRDMLSCNRRRVVNRLLRALHATESMAADGSLPEAWRWILESRLVFIAKKKGPAPRPVRVGELWRRMIAKFLLHKSRAKIKQRMLAANQFGVALPGGAEVLIHTQLARRMRPRRCCSWSVGDN